jgi:hypothetical protein
MKFDPDKTILKNCAAMAGCILATSKVDPRTTAEMLADAMLALAAGIDINRASEDEFVERAKLAYKFAVTERNRAVRAQ